MRFSVSLYTVAVFAASVFAAENPLSQPTTEIIAGEENIIKWTSTTPGKVTLYLKQGKPEDLKTVQKIDIVDGAKGNTTWTPSTEYAPGSDYAIEIVSEDNEPNYTGLLTLKNASGYSSYSSSASSTSSSAYPSSSSTAPSSTVHPYGHSTMVSAPISTGTGTPYGSGYGHNATYHNSTTIRKTYSKGSSTTSSESSSETSSSAESQSSGKVSAIPPSPSDSGAMALVRSPLAFVICVFGAIIYLN